MPFIKIFIFSFFTGSEMIVNFTLIELHIVGSLNRKIRNLQTFFINNRLKLILVWLTMEAGGLLQFCVVIFAFPFVIR